MGFFFFFEGEGVFSLLWVYAWGEEGVEGRESLGQSRRERGREWWEGDELEFVCK